MTAVILKFRPRPNPRRDAELAAQALIEAMCAPWLAWAGMFNDPSPDDDRPVNKPKQ